MKSIVITALLVCLPLFAASDFPNPVPDGTYTIHSLNSAMVMDDPGSSQVAGTQVIQWGSNGGSNQRWSLIFSCYFSGYLISSDADPQLFLSDAGGKLTLQYQDSPAHQYWALDAVTNGYVIRNLDTGRVIDVSGALKTAGTKIITWPKNGGLNQSWSFR